MQLPGDNVVITTVAWVGVPGAWVGVPGAWVGVPGAWVGVPGAWVGVPGAWVVEGNAVGADDAELPEW